MDLSSYGPKEIKMQKLKIILSALVGGLGSGIFSFGIGLLILRETGSASNFGFSQMIGPLVSLFLLPFTGSIIDQFNHKKIAIYGQVASIAGIIMFLLADHYQVLARLPLIYALLIVLRISDLFLSTTYIASTISMVPEGDVQKIMSYKQVISTATMILSPILGAILYQALSFQAFVGVEVGTEILTLLLVLRINFYMFIPQPDPVEKKAQVKGGIGGMVTLFKKGLTYIANHPVLRFMVVFSMFINFLFPVITVGLPYVQIQIFQFSNSQFGIVEAAFGLGLLLAGLALSQAQTFKNPLYMAWLLIFALFLNLFLVSVLIYLPFSQDFRFIGMVLSVAVMGGLVGVINIPLNVWATKTIPPKLQGRVFNILSTSSQLLLPVGILMVGGLLDCPLGPGLLFALVAGLGIIVNLALPLALKVSVKTILGQNRWKNGPVTRPIAIKKEGLG